MQKGDPDVGVHSAKGVAHESAQVPPEQTCPSAQARPHAPQWLASVMVDTQAPAHAVCPVWQSVLHAPDTQAWPDGHPRPHAIDRQ